MLRTYLSTTLTSALAVALMTASSPNAKGPVYRLAPKGPNISHADTQSIPGQSQTLLPDGRLLLIGGEGPDGPVATIFIKNRQSSAATILPVSLARARAWHTATVLPDGTVFIFGGLGTDGQPVEVAELFTPTTNQVSSFSFPKLRARAHHTATLLTDGRLVLIGGVSSKGETIDSAQVWDYRLPSVEAEVLRQQSFRKDHQAILQGDGTVFVFGGTNQFGAPVDFAEIFDPSSQTFLSTAEKQPAQDPEPDPELRLSIPSDGSQDVPIATGIALRFSRPLDVATINGQTVSLSTGENALSVRVVGAEGGILAFVTPGSTLNEGTTYTLTLNGVMDWKGIALPQISISFTTVQPMTPVADPSSEGDDVWIPNPQSTFANLGKSGQGQSANQSFPPLQGKPGETAVTGQALRLNGEPLDGVTLSIDNVETRTDITGRFLLAPLTAGHHVMLIDGTTANRKGRSYGIFEVGVDVVAGKTNVLGYTIWMTGLDMAHAVTIPSPTTSEVVIKTPLLPGLELHLPPQTTITDRNGKPVTKISITPIPIDQPPFPLPVGVPVPTYFTIQPGSAYIKVGNTSGPQGAQLYYPNSYHFPFGTVFSFYNYDPDQKGWFVYGHGKVGKDASQVVPDPGTVIYEFTGAMVGSPSNAPPAGPKRGNPKRGDPVDLQTGLFVYTKTDLTLPGQIPLVLTRTYRQGDLISRAFGIGASHPYDMFLVGDTFPYTYIDLVLADGGRIHFARSSPCTGGSCGLGANYIATSTPGDFYGATIQFFGGNLVQSSGWILTKKDGTVYIFPDSFDTTVPQLSAVIGIKDRYGNFLTLTRDSNRNLTKISNPNGRWIQFTYDASNRITVAQDNIGRTVNYTYDSGGRLSTVTDVNGGTWTYAYDSFNNMLTITDPRNTLYLTNQYDGNSRTAKQTNADGGFFQYAYNVDASGNITQTTVTDPRGIVEQVAFNPDGYEISDITALGRPEQQSIASNRQQGSGLVLSEVDALNRQTAHSYDAMGNQTSLTFLAGTANPVTINFAYEPVFNQVSAVTDPLGHTTTFNYDSMGNVVAATNPLGNTLSFAYNSKGQILSATDPLGNIARYTYNANFDLVAITDPLGRTTSAVVDAGGRLASQTDQLGNTTTFAYNASNQPTSMTDAQGDQTALSYDGNGNLLTVTDANNHITTYTYDNMDRILTRKDALMNQDSYQYDLNGNVSQLTDRRGKVTTYTYDGLGRAVFVGFGTQAGPTYESSVNYTYDSAYRLTQISDSTNGAISWAYDNLDQIKTESTPQGSITYAYDAAGRRSTMQVTGQPMVSYGYDNGDNLLQISQSSSIVSFGYDTAGDRTTVNFPNGVTVSSTYDAGSQLTALNYSNGSSLIGNLAYSYDGNGRRTSTTGSLATTNLPLAISTTAYNAGNQLTNWGTASLFHDANGNLTSDGSHSYSWNSRNQLTAIDSGATATFTYDPVGRRSSKNILGVSTAFLHDGANTVQELSGSTPVANLLTGGVDEYFTRSDSSGLRTFLSNGTGSTIGLVDSSGALQTQYGYDPFGSTTVAGAATTNSFAYTGREADISILYYYRARYYSPQFNRFISEDPLGFGGGSTNLYEYALDDPTDLGDPTGMQAKPRPTIPIDPPPGRPILVEPSPGGSGEPSGAEPCWWCIILWELLDPPISGNPEQDFLPPKCENSDCQRLLTKGLGYVMAIQREVIAMLEDPGQLFLNAYNVPNPAKTGTNTTWVGHQKEIRDLQKGLRDILKELTAKGCPIPPGWWRTATTPPPSRPMKRYW